MMIYGEDHLALQRTIDRFVDEEINPNVDAWEEEGIFPAHALFKKMGALGLLGLNKPVEYGGAGLDYSYGVLLAEGIGRIHCGAVPMSIGVQTDMATPALSRFGSDELRREYLAPTITGEFVSCIGVSEPGAGSDVAGIRTNARADGGDYIINGSKLWITNGIQADWMCCLANTGDGPVHRNKSLIVLPLKAKGVTVARKLRKIGMNASDTALLHFDDVRVPRHNLIGEEGQGFTYQMLQFQEERLWSIAANLKGMESAIEETAEYARQRNLFGKTLLDNQVVQFTLAELRAEVEALRSLLYRATAEYLAGQDVTLLASMGKLKAGRLMRQVSDRCLQYWGGMGFTWENRVSRLYRDGRLLSIGGGADEVMLQIIAKRLGYIPSRTRRN